MRRCRWTVSSGQQRRAPAWTGGAGGRPAAPLRRGVAARGLLRVRRSGYQARSSRSGCRRITCIPQRVRGLTGASDRASTVPDLSRLEDICPAATASQCLSAAGYPPACTGASMPPAGLRTCGVVEVAHLCVLDPVMRPLACCLPDRLEDVGTSRLALSPMAWIAQAICSAPPCKLPGSLGIGTGVISVPSYGRHVGRSVAEPSARPSYGL